MAAAAALLAVPVGFALSPVREPGDSRSRFSIAKMAVTPVASRSVAVQAPAAILVAPVEPSGSILDDVPDAAKLFLVGTLLVGAAAAARKAA